MTEPSRIAKSFTAGPGLTRRGLLTGAAGLTLAGAARGVFAAGAERP